MNSSFGSTIESFVKEHLNFQSETATEICCFCPFHANNDTPCFYVNKRHGQFYCFNPSCGAKGSFRALQRRIGVSGGNLEASVSEDELTNMLLENEPAAPDWDSAIERVMINYDDKRELSRIQYLLDRGFHPEILRQFDVGYSERQNRIVIPVRDEDYKVVGFIGRAIDAERKPKYKYSTGFPRSSILFNLCNAKHHRSVYVVEGSLDAIAVHSAGFSNVVATLGANVSDEHCNKLKKYFNDIILLSDKDDAGEGMKRGIINRCSRLNIWTTIFPEGIKDPGEMTHEQIKDTIQNKVNYLDELIGEN